MMINFHRRAWFGTEALSINMAEKVVSLILIKVLRKAAYKAPVMEMKV